MANTVLAKFNVTLDPRVTRQRAMDDAGLDFRPANVEKLFADDAAGRSQVELCLVHFARDLFSDEVIRELQSRRLRPATFEELLGFAASYRRLRCPFEIVALGSIAEIGGRRNSASIWCGRTRRLQLVRWGGPAWPAECRFLAALQ
jgi:hypothetical protein